MGRMTHRINHRHLFSCLHRTLKENFLWVRHFATVVELIEALREFRRRYNEQWLIERHGYRSPAQVRRDLTAPIPAVA